MKDFFPENCFEILQIFRQNRTTWTLDLRISLTLATIVQEVTRGLTGSLQPESWSAVPTVAACWDGTFSLFANRRLTAGS